jgi:Holliday junction DNA helicase RuvA
MIGAMFGTVHSVRSGVATIYCASIGYEVHISRESYDEREPYPFGDGPWWIHEHAPQDAPHELYGFEKREERDLFRRLLNIKGVGPKVAMRIVAAGFGTTAEFRYHEALTKIRGVGATLAQRIVEEMQI